MSLDTVQHAKCYVMANDAINIDLLLVFSIAAASTRLPEYFSNNILMSSFLAMGHSKRSVSG